MRKARSVLLLAAALVLMLWGAAANHLVPSDGYPVWALDRTVAASNSSPMAEAVRGDGASRRALGSLLAHFGAVERTMRTLLADSDYSRTTLRNVCNASNAVQIVALDVRMRTLGLGRWMSSCITDLQLGDVGRLWRDFGAYYAALGRSGQQIVSAARGVIDSRTDADVARQSGTPWLRTYTHYNFTYDGHLQVCDLRHIVAFRAKGQWVLLSSLTSHDPAKNLVNRGRQYLEEYITLAGARVGNLYVNVNNTAMRRERATTTLSTWGGMPAFSIFVEIADLTENPAIAAALADGARWLEQAEDSLAAANISIMVLSCALALVPVALFADVGPLVALLYTLVTDVVSCMPLAIKGMELILLSKQRNAAVRTRVYGMDDGSDLAASELWVARCATRNELAAVGVLFLVGAILIAIVGVILEIYCRRRLRQIKTTYYVDGVARRNSELTQRWANERWCAECNGYALPDTAATFPEYVHPEPLGSSGILAYRARRRRSSSAAYNTNVP